MPDRKKAAFGVGAPKAAGAFFASLGRALPLQLLVSSIPQQQGYFNFVFYAHAESEREGIISEH